MQLKLLKPFFSKPLFKGRENGLKFCITPKENIKKNNAFLFSDKVLAPYRGIEIGICNIYFSSGYCKKCKTFRAISRPFRMGLEN